MSNIFFIADIGANHDGDIERAKALIKQAADAGATAAKFQHFKADTIVSKEGFESLPKLAHQAKWSDGVYETYNKYAIPYEWTETLVDECKKNKIAFMSTPYDFESVELLNKFVDIWKIGSGDINNLPLIAKVAETGKPVIIATGASTLEEVIVAANVVLQRNPGLILMQCNTNYTGDKENEKHINANVLRSFKMYFETAGLGLSDHTRSNYGVMAAVALGARFIEKHFTDGKSKSPDNEFALSPFEFQNMVREANEIIKALGNNFKEVCANEFEARLVQRRCLRATRDLPEGHVLTDSDFIALRPAPQGSLIPFVQINGKTLKLPIKAGDYFHAGSFK